MSAKSTIGWTDATWPIVRGCSKISPGCDNCWAIRDAHLHAGAPNAKAAAHFAGLTALDAAGRPDWSGDVRLDQSLLLWPLHWSKPKTIFAASSGDLFHERLPDEEIDKVFAVMALGHWHHYQILTKRVERMRRYFKYAADLRVRWSKALLNDEIFPGDPLRGSMGSPSRAAVAEGFLKGWRTLALPNVALGVSVENEATAPRILTLRAHIPAAVRFVSYEPALASIDFRPYLDWGIDWLILGAESGPNARPASLEWFRRGLYHARLASPAVRPFMKQLGPNPEGLNAAELELWRKRPRGKDRAGADWKYWPNDLRVRQFPRWDLRPDRGDRYRGGVS